MKTCNLTFVSKNKNSLNSAFLFFLNMSSLNFKIIKKYFQKKTKKSFVTILKSPHVNKKAQEQFETHFYSKQLHVYLPKKQKYLFFLKKIQNKIFSDVKLKIKFSIHHKEEKKLNSVLFEPHYYLKVKPEIFISQRTKLNNKNKIIDSNFFITKKVVEILDIFGELNITN